METFVIAFIVGFPLFLAIVVPWFWDEWLGHDPDKHKPAADVSDTAFPRRR